MRILAHLSDLHFGRVDSALIEPLIETVANIKPDVVVVSGDLTQRARTSEFEAAREFLNRLPAPQIVVPGNHDVPLYDLASRFLRPLSRYRRYITTDLLPFYADQEIAVAGINTARSLTIKDGRINSAQLAHLRERFSLLADSVTKIVVTHHPFDLPQGYAGHALVGRARTAMDTFSSCGVGLLLAGHLHVAHAGDAGARYSNSGRSTLIIQAGTATSTRGRGEANSFNIIRLAGPEVTVERYVWQPELAAFVVSTTGRFRRTPDGWSGALPEGS